MIQIKIVDIKISWKIKNHIKVVIEICVRFSYKPLQNSSCSLIVIIMVHDNAKNCT